MRHAVLGALAMEGYVDAMAELGHLVPQQGDRDEALQGSARAAGAGGVGMLNNSR